MAQIRVSEEAAAELRRRADDEDRSIVAIVDRLLAQTRTEPERAAS